MNSFEHKTAFVTGAASGIGFALSKALIAEGANVVMVDQNEDALETAAASLSAPEKIATYVCDVADHSAVVAASEFTLERFGRVDLVFNNAGVSLAGKSGDIAIEDWRWIVDINVMGVVNGVEIFLPLIQKHGDGGHIVNTASMAGHFATSYMAPYHVTKYAVVGYSESLRQELEDTNIHVSVLCPTWVKSNIYNASNERPSLSGVPEDMSNNKVFQMVKEVVNNGMDADMFAALTLGAVKENRFYVFNDEAVRPVITARRDDILTDFDACLQDLAVLSENA